MKSRLASREVFGYFDLFVLVAIGVIKNVKAGAKGIGQRLRVKGER